MLSEHEKHETENTAAAAIAIRRADLISIPFLSVWKSFCRGRYTGNAVNNDISSGKLLRGTESVAAAY